jgi:hypothetical protein
MHVAIAGKLQTTTASQVLVGVTCDIPDWRGVGTCGVRVVAEGAGGLLGTSLFSWEGVLDLPLPFSSLVSLLTPLEIGHHCHFAALQDVNLHPHNLHCHCGWPLAASMAAFWHSHLNVQFLFHESCLFFWAWVAILVPLVRLKKA